VFFIHLRGFATGRDGHPAPRAVRAGGLRAVVAANSFAPAWPRPRLRWPLPRPGFVPGAARSFGPRRSVCGLVRCAWAD